MSPKKPRLSKLARSTARPGALERRVGADSFMTPADRQIGRAHALAKKGDVAGLRAMVRDESLHPAARVTASQLAEGTALRLRAEHAKEPNTWQLLQNRWSRLNRQRAPLVRKIQAGKKLTPAEQRKFDEISREVVKIQKQL